jgi:hypothetical protein
VLENEAKEKIWIQEGESNMKPGENCIMKSFMAIINITILTL